MTKLQKKTLKTNFYVFFYIFIVPLCRFESELNVVVI